MAAASASGASRPAVKTSRGCYAVGKSVRLRGTGFAPNRSYVVSVDGVYLGQSTTDGDGSFSTSLRPGGLGAGVAQSVDELEATDGSSTADTTFTLTRPKPGAQIQTTNSKATAARLVVWSFAPNGSRVPVFLHYVSPAGSAQRTVALGHTGGQCGYLRTGSRTVFPFTPAKGSWTFQLDTRKSYSKHPSGPVARIGVKIS